MRLTKVRMVLATVAALALMVGVGSAIAATRRRRTSSRRLPGSRTGPSMEAAVAKNLGTTDGEAAGGGQGGGDRQASTRRSPPTRSRRPRRRR